MRNTIIAAAMLTAVPGIAQTPAEESGAKAASAAGPAIELSTGIEYQEGEFGTGQKIETSSVPVTASVTTGRVQFSATLPYLRIDAPGNVVRGGGGLLGLPIIVDPTQPATRQRREGLGDLRLGAAYTAPIAVANLSVSGQVKVPTASAHKGLGTGEMDYAVTAELSRDLGGVTPFVGLGYTMPGDPDGYELRNSVSARAGAAIRMGPRTRGHVAYGYAQSLSPLVPDEQQVTTGLDAGLSERLSLSLWGSAGLSEGSPDVGAGITLGIDLR